MRVKYHGAYVVEAAKTITGATQANPAVINIPAHNYNVGDWIFIENILGMTELNGLTWIVNTVPDLNHVTLKDLFGNVVNSTAFGAYTSGGTAKRVYTTASPYAAIDLPFLKYIQSENTMSLTCVNPETLAEYPPYDLTRITDTNWVFTQASFASVIAPPTTVTATAQASTTLTTFYSYVVTAVDFLTGQESIASAVGSAHNNDISLYQGTNTITFSAVTGAVNYNIYKATPSYAVGVPLGTSFGFIGSSFGTSFQDTNIIPDFTQTPPLHVDPFARGLILEVTPTAGGAGYTQATVGFTVTTATGSGLAGTPVIVGGQFVAFVITNGGSGYLAGNTITITDSGAGAGAAATLIIGPATGTYPGVVSYYQQRRVYANTLNRPNTYFFSQPGAYLNFDSSVPAVDNDSIIGAPWAQQINGIQFLQPMTDGLIALTGNGAWKIGGQTAITPSTQTALSQAYNGCNNHIQPIVVNYDILYVQSKGSIVRDLEYNFFTAIYTGTDKSVLSNHLFNYHQIKQWAYAEEPYKLIWAIRDDGIMLSLTYLREQDVYAWARHDTNGFFVSVCSITEPPVDAIYVITKRFVRGAYRYYSERMDNRNWTNPENCFCVDSGLSYPMSFPNATLTPAAANGTSNITSVNLIAGGSGYVAPVITAIDSTGEGIGATFTATLSSGVITAITPVTGGAGYTPGLTTLQILDAVGTGAIGQPIITNNVIFDTSSAVFSVGNVGDVIRIGNNNATITISGITENGDGKAVITSYVSPTRVVANIIQPITAVIPNDPENRPVPAISNQWSLSTPVTEVHGLNHLEGLEVAILADGSVVHNQTVVDGKIILPQSYSAITIGLPYLCQLQTLYIDPPGQPMTVQGKRKNIYNVIIRVENSRGISASTNQPDQSTQQNNATPDWTDMKEIKERNNLVNAGYAIPMFTGDHYMNLPANWSEKGQVAIEQTFPLPANILAVISNYVVGDTNA